MYQWLLKDPYKLSSSLCIDERIDGYLPLREISKLKWSEATITNRIDKKMNVPQALCIVDSLRRVKHC